MLASSLRASSSSLPRRGSKPDVSTSSSSSADVWLFFRSATAAFAVAAMLIANFEAENPIEILISSGKNAATQRKLNSFTNLAINSQRHVAAAMAARSDIECEKAFITLLLLPNLFLPQRAAVRDITNAMVNNVPFKPVRTAHRSPDNATNSMNRAITRLMADFKVRSAVKILTTGADNLDFETKISMLRPKTLSEPSTAAHIAAPDCVLSSEALNNAIKNQSGQAANALDGWSKALLTAAINVDFSILDDLATVFSWCLMGKMSALSMDCLRAGRLVGIPKKDSCRPIVISSFLVRVIGSAVISITGAKCSEHQFAINRKRGAITLFHKVKASTSKFICKLDVKNAFNTTKRQSVADAIQTESPYLKQYFNSFCRPLTHLFIFGPQSASASIPFGERLRQGDATSALLFAKVMDRAISDIRRSCAQSTSIYAYMDDVTITTDSMQELRKAMDAAKAAFGIHGWEVELSKTIVHDPTTAPAQFRLLGGDLAESNDFIEEQKMKNTTFFSNLSKATLHPQVLYTLHKLLHLANVSTRAAEVAQLHNETLYNSLKELIGNDFDTRRVHDKNGLEIPDYFANAAAIYSSATTGTASITKLSIPLTTNLFEQSESAAFLMFYEGSMDTADYCVALALRLGTIPRCFDPTPCTCTCGMHCATPNFFASHTLVCPDAPIKAYTRHNLVRDAMSKTSRLYGISCIPEPTFYTYDDIHRRPDVTFMTTPPIATDVCLTAGDVETSVKHKTDLHHGPVATAGHIFIPSILKPSGFIHKCVYDLAKSISKSVNGAIAHWFTTEFIQGVQYALATARATTIIASFTYKTKSGVFGTYT